MLLLKILGAIAALGLGLYLGMAAPYRQSPDELKRALERGGRSRRAKRHFTPLGWLRKDERGSHRRRKAGPGRFNLSAPDSSQER